FLFGVLEVFYYAGDCLLGVGGQCLVIEVQDLRAFFKLLTVSLQELFRYFLTDCKDTSPARDDSERIDRCVNVDFETSLEHLPNVRDLRRSTDEDYLTDG